MLKHRIFFVKQSPVTRYGLRGSMCSAAAVVFPGQDSLTENNPLHTGFNSELSSPEYDNKLYLSERPLIGRF